MGCPLLVIPPISFLCQQPPIRTYLKSSIFSHYNAFFLFCLSFSLYQMQVIVTALLYQSLKKPFLLSFGVFIYFYNNMVEVTMWPFYVYAYISRGLPQFCSLLPFCYYHENKPGLTSWEFKGLVQFERLCGAELRCSFEIMYTLQWSCLEVRSPNKEAEKLSDLGVIWMMGKGKGFSFPVN